MPGTNPPPPILSCSRRLHAAGLVVVAWTVDDPARAATLVAWSIDGLTTDSAAVADTHGGSAVLTCPRNA